MNIKDPEVHAMAKALAGRRRTTVTGAVREALTEALARDAADRTGVAQRLLDIAERSRAIEAPILTDEDLYGDDGLPR